MGCGQARNGPPEAIEAATNSSQDIVERVPIASDDIPDEKVHHRRLLVSQQMVLARIADRQHSHLRSRPLIAKGTGSIVDQPRGAMSVMIPVIQAGPKAIMDITR